LRNARYAASKHLGNTRPPHAPAAHSAAATKVAAQYAHTGSGRNAAGAPSASPLPRAQRPLGRAPVQRPGLGTGPLEATLWDPSMPSAYAREDTRGVPAAI